MKVSAEKNNSEICREWASQRLGLHSRISGSVIATTVDGLEIRLLAPRGIAISKRYQFLHVLEHIYPSLILNNSTGSEVFSFMF
jgi:hypothetical protein